MTEKLDNKCHVCKTTNNLVPLPVYANASLEELAKVKLNICASCMESLSKKFEVL